MLLHIQDYYLPIKHLPQQQQLRGEICGGVDTLLMNKAWADRGRQEMSFIRSNNFIRKEGTRTSAWNERHFFPVSLRVNYTFNTRPGGRRSPLVGSVLFSSIVSFSSSFSCYAGRFSKLLTALYRKFAIANYFGWSNIHSEG